MLLGSTSVFILAVVVVVVVVGVAITGDQPADVQLDSTRKLNLANVRSEKVMMEGFSAKDLGSMHNRMMTNVYQQILSEQSFPGGGGGGVMTQKQFDNILLQQLSIFCKDSHIEPTECLKGMDNVIVQSKVDVDELFASGGVYDLHSLLQFHPSGFGFGFQIQNENEFIIMDSLEEIYRSVHQLNETNRDEIMESIHRISDVVGRRSNATQIETLVVQSVASIAAASTDFWYNVYKDPDHLFHNVVVMEENPNPKDVQQKNRDIRTHDRSVRRKRSSIFATRNDNVVVNANVNANTVFRPIPFIVADVVGAMGPALCGIAILAFRLMFLAIFPNVANVVFTAVSLGWISFRILRGAVCSSLQTVGVRLLRDRTDVILCELSGLFHVTDAVFPGCDAELSYGSVLGGTDTTHTHTHTNTTSFGKVLALVSQRDVTGVLRIIRDWPIIGRLFT